MSEMLNQETKQEHKPLTAEELAAIRERADKATEGPWESGLYPGEEMNAFCVEYSGGFLCGSDTANAEADLNFIAHTRTDIPRLLATVEVLDAHLAEAQADNAALLEALERNREGRHE